MAIAAARIADDKRATDVVVLHVEPLTVVTDYFVICSGDTSLQVRAISTAVEEGLEQLGARRLRREGTHESRWLLLDYGAVVVHIFNHAEREYYDLERLWGDARHVSWAPQPQRGASGRRSRRVHARAEVARTDGAPAKRRMP